MPTQTSKKKSPYLVLISYRLWGRNCLKREWRQRRLEFLQSLSPHLSQLIQKKSTNQQKKFSTLSQVFMGMDVDGFLRKMKEDKDVREREGGWVLEKNKGEGGCERERREEKEEKC